jgi:hypothetical protein
VVRDRGRGKCTGDNGITLAVSGRDFSFKGKNAKENERGDNQTVCGVSGIEDDDLIVVHG